MVQLELFTVRDIDLEWLWVVLSFPGFACVGVAKCLKYCYICVVRIPSQWLTNGLGLWPLLITNSGGQKKIASLWPLISYGFKLQQTVAAEGSKWPLCDLNLVTKLRSRRLHIVWGQQQQWLHDGAAATLHTHRHLWLYDQN